MLAAWHAAGRFDLGGPPVDVQPYGRGLINDTYLVTTAGFGRVILQRINRRVFPSPPLIMANLRILLDHIHRCQARFRDLREFRLPAIHRAVDGGDFYRDREGGYWRALGFIENTRSNDRLATPEQAREVGFALGRFHALASGLAPGRLHDTLPGFHITPRYLERFLAVAARSEGPAATAELRFCVDFIEARKLQAGVLEQAKARGLLALRPIHGDPKLSNILFDEHSGRAVSLVDLDTVKPGLIHYDIGDCLRSCCNSAGESAPDSAAVDFDLDICRAVLESYFAEVRGFLTRPDCAYLYAAIRLIPFELGLRFLTDYLEGNRYFKVEAPEQNLQRALIQFHLTLSIERKQRRIERLIAGLASARRGD